LPGCLLGYHECVRVQAPRDPRLKPTQWAILNLGGDVEKFGDELLFLVLVQKCISFNASIWDVIGL